MSTRTQDIALPVETAARIERDPKSIRGMNWQPSWSLIRVIIALLPPLLATAGILIDFRTTHQVIEGRLTSTSSLIANYAAAALAQATTTSSVLADFIARHESRGAGAGDETARLAADLVNENLAISAVLAIASDGETVAERRVEAAEWPGDAASTLLRAHWDNATEGALVSRPYLGPTNGERQFNVSVAVRGADGEPQYVVASVIVARDLLEQLSRASPYRDFTITFFDREGNVFARHPSIGGNLERLRVDLLPPLDSPAFADRGLFYVGHLKFSPRLRFINVLQVSGFPVYVTYSAAYWEALGPWLQRSLVVGVTSIAAAALLFIALSQLMVASRREVEAERSMREAVDRERKAEIVAIRNQDREVIARMAGGVGHEFNNLMGGVLGIGELLTHPNVDGRETVAAGRQLTAVAERGGTLAHALMIYGGRGFLDFQVVDLCDLVRSAVEAFRTTVGPGVEISTRLPAALLQARVDPDKLASAIGHLMMNAVSALPDAEGKIVVTIEADRPLPPGGTMEATHRAAVSVVDNGVGMSAETLARARDPFFTTRDVGRGAGLGLSMVDGLVKASNGHLELESRPGAGTRVTMWLPLTQGADEPRPPS
jgi:signal transduction histidine kinase